MTGEVEINEKPYDVFESIVARSYDIYLSEEIIEPNRYNHLFNLFRSVSPNDTINIYVNSEGGDLHTGLQFIKAMKACQARVITYLDGTAMSLAPLLLFAGDDIVVTEHSMIMFHDYSTVQYGKGNELVKQNNAYADLYVDMLYSYACPFLTEDEVTDIVTGKDMYCTGDDITQRIERIMKMNESAQEESNAAAETLDMVDNSSNELAELTKTVKAAEEELRLANEAERLANKEYDDVMNELGEEY